MLRKMRRVPSMFTAAAALIFPLPISVTALTQQQIDDLDGNIILGNRVGGKIQIFPSAVQSWNASNILWEYDTRKGVDGLTMTFDWINDVKRVRYNNTQYVLVAGNGPGLALMNLHTEQFVFSYKPRVPAGISCSMKSLSIHSADMLPDGNFAVADPTGNDRGGASVRLIYGSNDNPQILTSLPFSGVHGVVWDYKRQRLWAFGGSKLKRYRYVSAGLDSALIQDGLAYKSPQWISVGHDMMPYGKDALIFTCAQGVGVFYIVEERFELLYGNINEATNVIPDTKVQRGKGLDFNPYTDQMIHNIYNTNSIRSPTHLTNGTMMEWTYRPQRHVEAYKARWFIHSEFSYGPANADESLIQQDQMITSRASKNRRPTFSDTHRRNAILIAGKFYKRNIRKQATDPDEDRFSPKYEKICGPSWLSVTRAGIIKGEPDSDDIDDDYHKMMIRVSDKGGLSDVATFQFRVNASPSSMPTSLPTTLLYTERMKDSDELSYFGPDEVGPKWKRTGLGPLGRCKGDCDNDDECGPGLVCFQRSGFQNNVPGCGGSAVENVDYCVNPSQDFENLTYIGEKGPFGVCGGDCDNDDDCVPGLICYQRDGNENDVPGCSSSPLGKVKRGTDYCISPTTWTPTGDLVPSPTSWTDFYGQLDPQEKGGEGDNEIASVPSTLITTASPSKPLSDKETRAPSKMPSTVPPTTISPATTEPTSPTAAAQAWDAFMAHVKKYANGKKDEETEPPTPVPTTEFQAAWAQSTAKWKDAEPTDEESIVEKEPTSAPIEFYKIWPERTSKWNGTSTNNKEEDAPSP